MIIISQVIPTPKVIIKSPLTSKFYVNVEESIKTPKPVPMLHCDVIIVTDDGSRTDTGDLGNKLIPKSNTTDNMMKMIIDLLSLIIY